MKYILKDGSVVDSLPDYYSPLDWSEAILTRREILERDKLLLDLLAEKATKSGTIDSL